MKRTDVKREFAGGAELSVLWWLRHMEEDQLVKIIIGSNVISVKLGGRP